MKAELLSFGYRSLRKAIIFGNYYLQDLHREQHDLEPVIEIGDKLLRILPNWFSEFSIPDGLETKVYDLTFPSPILLSSFKEDIDIIEIWLRLGLGGAILKTIMKDERAGNHRPRILETTNGGLINAMGLPGKGVEGKISEIKESGLFSYGRPIGLSIGGSTIDEYKYVFDKLNNFLYETHCNTQYFYEINISCPNTPEGQQIQNNPQLLEELLYYMREVTDVPIFVKLSPDMSDEDIKFFADLIGKYPKVGLNLGNTQSKTCEEVGLKENAISTGKGGLSGPSLYQRTIDMATLIRGISRYNEIAIISTGGVNSIKKVEDLLEIGSNLVGMTTAVVKDMYCIPVINKNLKIRK